MNKISLKDLKIKEKEVVNKRVPLFLWMKEKDIYGIEYFDGCIYWYNKDWLKKYYEDSDGYWSKRKYKDWLETYFENSKGVWWKKEYKDWLETYFEDSNGFWIKRKYKDWLEISYENSNGDWSETKYKDWLEISYEDSNGYLWKVEEWKKIEYKNWKYYIDWEEAELIHR